MAWAAGQAFQESVAVAQGIETILIDHGIGLIFGPGYARKVQRHQSADEPEHNRRGAKNGLARRRRLQESHMSI